VGNRGALSAFPDARPPPRPDWVSQGYVLI
jgi:hypothetical protein